MTTRLSKIGHRPDYFLMALVFILAVAGLLILASASSELGRVRFNDTYYFLKHQLKSGFLLGILGFLVAYKVHYQHYRKAAFVFLLVNLGLLSLVFTKFGYASGGASRWLNLGLFSFQPSELLKITFILYLAAWLTNPKMNRSQGVWDGLLPFFVICGLVAGLLILQPATSTVVILITSGFVIYFLSGAKLKHIAFAGLAGLLALGLVVVVTPYRLQRVKTFLNPEKDSLGAGYQVNQAMIAIGSGGFWGTGYGQSTSKVGYLPTPTDDSIFAVAAQELGFIGASLLITFFALLVLRMLYLAHQVRDKFGQFVLVGFAAILGLQSLINMGAISGLFPLTGVPLPFVSYGGTALAVFLTMSGIAVNISKYT